MSSNDHSAVRVAPARSSRTGPAPRAQLLVVAVLAAGALTACGGQTPPPGPPPSAAPPATTAVTPTVVPSPADVPNIPPEERDAKFAEALASKNLQTGSPEDRTQAAGRICQSLDANTPLSDLVNQTQTDLGGPSVENTGFVIGAATAVYCPNNLPKLKQN